VLAKDEWFAVRAGKLEGEPVHSVAWTKEHTYVYDMSDASEYIWEIVVCRGDPADAYCEQMTVSEQGTFSFQGCSQ